MTEYLTEDEKALTHELINETPNEDRINIIMGSTYSSRSLWVREGRPPIKTIFLSFPPLRDIYSSAFEEEFCRSAPNSKHLVEGLGDCFSRILLYAKGKCKGLSTDLAILLDEIAADNNLLEKTKQEYALLLLPLMLSVPMRNRQRASVVEVCKRFVQLHPVSNSYVYLILSMFYVEFVQNVKMHKLYIY
ncbi:uncharacterized protein LOC136090127 [Hydra vulgaris]|uniref:Uncharacterized protein LOC136090127 n=1 Tax=Hydra vulgaris TaxID=6087 RepID=A0ABM4DD35_HYDVU